MSDEVTNEHNRTARIVGFWFIAATVSAVVGSIAILDPILSSPDYLTSIADNSTKVIVGVLVDAINSLAVVVIPVLLYPIFRRHNETLAVGYVASRIVESLIQIVGHISLLSLVTVSDEFVQAGTAAAPYYQALGDLLRDVSEWTHLLGPVIVFSLTALILNRILYQSMLVPRWISIWGFIGGILLLASGLLGMFGLDPFSTIAILMTLPIALNEMVLAVWLVAKGFSAPAQAAP